MTFGKWIRYFSEKESGQSFLIVLWSMRPTVKCYQPTWTFQPLVRKGSMLDNLSTR